MDVNDSGPGVSGLALNQAFYEQVVAPIVAPWPHTGALLGWGSDVLGYDTARSTDHGWGPRLQVFVAEPDIAAVRDALDDGLPAEFGGWPVRYGWDSTPVGHHVEAAAVGPWLRAHLGRDPRGGMRAVDWLLTPQQLLLGVVGGAVYHDGLGRLDDVRRTLRWYPDDVWRWLIACQWHRLAQEEAFCGRTAELGDALGSRLVAARLVREIMRLAFLFDRQYWPYTKWFGTAFARLPSAARLAPLLTRVVDAADHPRCERALAEAFEAIARSHNATGIGEPVDPTVRTYYDRPFLVLMADRFADACRDGISDPWLRALPLVGSIDQFADSTDVLQFPERVNRLVGIYDASQTRAGRA